MKNIYSVKPLIKKQITFLIFNEADYSSRQLTVSRLAFVLTALSVSAVICLTGFMAIRCVTLSKKLSATAPLVEASRSQRNQVSEQTQQIALLNEKLNGLTERLEQLQSLRNQICKIGRIEQPASNDNLFGIGGSRDDDTARSTENTKNGGPGIGNSGSADSQASAGPDSTDFKGCSFTLSATDCQINPIACVPAVLPMKATKVADPRQYQQTAPGRNDPHGILIQSAQGDEITAPANGIIAFIDTKNDPGDTLIIDHGHGYVTRYTRLADVTKGLDDFVMKGEIIGHAKTDRSKAVSQCYYEITVNGLPIHPDKYFSSDPLPL